MTPAARLSAAIDILDRILQGQSADHALTAWARGNRFAGSSDRLALRDLVFTALRCKRSHAALGGGLTGRGLILGGLRDAGVGAAQIDALFSGQGHAPAVIGPADQPRAPTAAEAMDLPDWLIDAMHQSLGDDLPRTAAALRARAPVFLRVNPARAPRGEVMAELAAAGVETQLISSLQYGLKVIEGERKISTLPAFSEGRIEVQDAASQAVIEALDLPQKGEILDYCAGAGGKILSIAAQVHDRKYISLYAHDADPRRMVDLPPRAARAGAQITVLTSLPQGRLFDLILTDVPCSGSGSWRRDPQGKWALTPARLSQLHALQAQILDQAAQILAPRGQIAYSTCSVLHSENEAQIAAFLARNPEFHCQKMQRFHLHDAAGGDGFFLAVLAR